jgi:hypothetical protein
VTRITPAQAVVTARLVAPGIHAPARAYNEAKKSGTSCRSMPWASAWRMAFSVVPRPARRNSIVEAVGLAISVKDMQARSGSVTSAGVAHQNFAYCRKFV